MNRGWKIALAIFAGFFIFAGIISAIGGSIEDEPVKQEKKAIERVEESAKEIEDYTVETENLEADKPVVEIYDEVELGMEESEVWGIAGKPEITSQVEDAELGTVLELIYSDGHSLDNVTIMFDDGKVALVVLGIFDGETVAVKSKM